MTINLRTATELYNIVHDVPREAWPERLTCDSPLREWRLRIFRKARNDIVEAGLDVQDAELLFEASMTRHLIGLGYHQFNYVLGDSSVTLELYDKSFTVSLESTSRVQTTTRLLALACKAVGNA